MILISIIAAGILIGLIRGGRFRGLADLRLRRTWLPVALFTLQAVLVRSSLRELGWGLFVTPLVVTATYVALVGFLVVNRSRPGIKFALAGGLLNLAVITANGGYMPVTVEALERSGHQDRIIFHEDQAFVAGSRDVVLELDETRLWPLSEILGIPEGFPFAENFSVGDILIAVGVGILAYDAVRRVAEDRVEVRIGTTVESGRWTISRREDSDA